ncbi:MAG: hypothetical protein ACYDED_15035 [Ferrimicrobium sp.]
MKVLPIPELVQPRVPAARSLHEVANIFVDDTHLVYPTEIRDLSDDELPGFVERLLAVQHRDAPRSAGFVPSTHLRLVDNDVYLGRVQIRHRLTYWPFLNGGHISYCVVSRRERRAMQQ